MKTNGWHKRVLLKHAKEITTNGMTYAVIALVLLLWHFALDMKFQWQQIAPLSEPSIFVRAFYSAFTFGTLGLLLYVLRFYKVLHDIMVKAFGMWELYNLIKAVIWLGLMYVSYAYLVPWLFKFLNTGASVLFNIANLVLYIAPPIGIALIVSIIYLILKNKFALRHRAPK